MKKYMILMVVLSTLQVKAQQFKIEQADNMNKEVLSADKEVWSSDVYIHNTSKDSVVLAWECTKNTLHEDWSYSMCEYGRCFIGVPEKSVIRPIPPGEKGFIKLHLNPDYVPGKGELVFRVYEKGKPETAQKIHFSVEATRPK